MKQTSSGLSGRHALEPNAQHDAAAGWHAVVHAAVTLIDQCEQFVRDVPETIYASESEVLPGGTVGKHLRHLVDHYEAIAYAASAAHGVALIDYDHRERDVPMEVNREAALIGLARLRERVAQLRSQASDRPLPVKVMVTGDGHEATLQSSLGRELAFATHHAVHHQAMMKAIAGEFGVEAGSDFGKAPSTINHEISRR